MLKGAYTQPLRYTNGNSLSRERIRALFGKELVRGLVRSACAGNVGFFGRGEVEAECFAYG